MRLFLEWFTETAMFSAFIESRLESESDVRGEWTEYNILSFIVLHWLVFQFDHLQWET
jgi:hypothetical protein